MNEFFGEVSELKKAREEIIAMYQKKEPDPDTGVPLTEVDALVAIKAIDKKIAESRGGSIAREGASGAVGGVVGTAVGAGITAAGGGLSAPAGVVGGLAAGTGAAMAFDEFAGDTIEKGGRAVGGAINSLFGSSREDLVKELNTPIKPKEEAPKGNTEAGVTPDTDMGFQMTGRKEFDKDLVNQQAATPGVTPDIAGVMPSANETPEQPKGKVEKPLSEEATKLIDDYMKEYQSGLKAMMTVMPPETKKEDLVAKADEYKRFDVGMMRKLQEMQEIKRTPGQGIFKKLKEKKLEAAEKLLQDKRIKNAESSDAGNLGTDYKATELTPTVETPVFDAMGNAGGVNISGGEEVQSAMEAARASDEGSMGLITTAREMSPELNKNSVQMQRASNRSKFGRNAIGLDAFMGYNDDPPPLALPTADQAAGGSSNISGLKGITPSANSLTSFAPDAVPVSEFKGDIGAAKTKLYQQMGNKGEALGLQNNSKVESAGSESKDEKINKISQSSQTQTSSPVIIKQGDTINQITNNSTSGGNSGGGGSPSRMQNPWDLLTLGKPWDPYP